MVRIQNEYTLDPLENYLRAKPTANLTELYSLCNATSKNEKSAVRTKRKRLLERIDTDVSKVPLSNPKPEIIPPRLVSNVGLDHLTEEVIEQKVLQNLLHSGTSQDVRNAIDFYSKIKATHDSTKEIDMEQFFLIGGDNADS